MTDIEQKALALVNEVSFTKEDDLRFCNRDQFREALFRAIEQHEAFRREVSDAVEEYFDPEPWDSELAKRIFARFIIDKPDPLVEAVAECDGTLFGKQSDYVKALRAAIEKRGGKIVWGEG